ncbi:ABC transporter substrate-binding protein [Treponema sp.]|uniref:ABC transporter substrate-binding protein n=1 Tax=Treponema sp. TaxID=166 RepID=UPI00388D3B72
MKKIIIFALSLVFSLSNLISEDSYKIKVSSPNGAPALALAYLAEKNPEDYKYVAAEAISAEFAAANSDFIIAPVNAGAKLFKMGKSTYKLAAVVTWGNLYFASQKKNFSLKDIKKSGITLFGENTINSSVALSVLENNKIRPKSVTYLGSAAATLSLLLSDSKAVVLTAEPALSGARLKNPQITAYPVNELYKKATGFEGYTQAGLFVRTKTIEEQPEAVREYLKLAAQSCEKCAENPAEIAKVAVKLEILPNEKIAEKAIPNCSIRYLNALDAKEQVETTAKIDLAQFGSSLPADDFYYGEK